MVTIDSAKRHALTNLALIYREDKGSTVEHTAEHTAEHTVEYTAKHTIEYTTKRTIKYTTEHTAKYTAEYTYVTPRLYTSIDLSRLSINHTSR